MSKWTEDELRFLHERLKSGAQHVEIAAVLGRSTGAIRNMAHRLNVVRDRAWSDGDVAALRELYQKAGENGVLNLAEFSEKIGRNKGNVSRKAKQLGLPVSQNRKRVEQRKQKTRMFNGDDEAVRQHASERMRNWIQENGHPRGALGLKHSPATRTAIAAASAAQAANRTPERQAAITRKALETRERNGTLVPERPHGSWKAGWHEIGGRRKYYRSNWEANYARYLEWLKSLGEILDWHHEPKTFWFDGIKRGAVSYLPDFLVIEKDGQEVYHEVKGWMDDRSRVKIERMRRYHPSVQLVVINSKVYQELRRKVSSLVPGWQDIPRDRRGA